MRKGRMAAVAATATIGLLLTACGGDDTEGSAEPANTTEATSSAAPSSDVAEPIDAGDDEDSGAAPADAGEITEPGTTLAFGETATLPADEDDPEAGTIGVTVTGIEKGDHADLPKKSDGSELDERITPYYLKYTLTNNTGDSSVSSSVYLNGTLDDGGRTGAVLTVMGGIDKCDRGSRPSDWDQPGSTMESCKIQGSALGDVTEVHFDDYDAYKDDPIVWTE